MQAKQKLEDALRKAILEKFPSVELSERLLEEPKADFFGDYATSIPLKLAKEAGKSPQEVAQEILSLLKSPEEFSKAEIAGAGFINFSFSQNFLENILQKALKEGENFGRSDFGKGKRVIIEYSDPNIAKPLGIHHLLATIIGQAICNIHRFLGYEIIAINYIGDWGTQFGKLLYALKTWGDREKIGKNPIPEFLKLYVKFHELAEKNPSLEDKGREEFRKLEEGEKENLKLWEWIREVSLKDIQKTYDLLGGIHFDLVQGEAFYRDKMEPILDREKKLGVFRQGEKGAWLVFFENEKYPPFMVQKADGTTLYATRDLAVIDDRLKTYRPSKILYVVDNAQTLYFKQLFEAAKMMGYETSPLFHVVFGRMSFPEGKMSTRKGTVVLLNSVIDEVTRRAKEILEERRKERERFASLSVLPEKEKDNVARKVGLGALKFAVLHQNRETNVKFTWEKMLSLEGESAPYLQYVHARCHGILRKAEKEGMRDWESGIRNGLREVEEVSLARLFPKFHEILMNAAESYQPNHLTRYLVKLATNFNLFYDKHPVLQVEGGLREARLALVSAVSMVLKTGLTILGIEAPERM